MVLNSRLFRGDAALEACLVRDQAHLVVGTRGDHIPKVQKALVTLDGALIDLAEVSAGLYGSTTARAVLDYKTARKVINFSYQTAPDNIVGKMTIASLDREMALSESRPPLGGCLNERLPGSRVVSDQVTQRGFAVGDVPPPPPVALRVVFQNAITPNFGIDRARPLLLLIARANLLLAPHGMRIDFNARLKSFPHKFSVTPEVAGDAEGLRKAVGKADPGAPNILRIIFCEFDGPEKFKTTAYAAGSRVGVNGFPNFVVMNPAISHPDRGTLLHEMIHASDDNLMFFGNNGHDTDITSVFSHGDNRLVLKQEHAIGLRKAFFAA